MWAQDRSGNRPRLYERGSCPRLERRVTPIGTSVPDAPLIRVRPRSTTGEHARKRSLIVRFLVPAVLAVGVLGGTAGAAEARPNDCAGLAKAMRAAYSTFQHYWAGGYTAEAQWWLNLYYETMDNYFDTCTYPS